MTENLHPLTETAAAEMWDARLDGSFWRELNPDQRENALTDMRSGWDAAMRAALSATLAVAPADPHHDPRPWEDCTVGDIREGDLLAARRGDTLIVGVAHHQDEHGDWNTEGNYLLTYGDRWPIRRIPAPTPPAEEVELPTEPHLLADVVLSGGEKIDEATWTGAVLLYARHPLAAHLVVVPADQIEQWTLDGTRARRHGEREDGTPRFVKEADQ